MPYLDIINHILLKDENPEQGTFAIYKHKNRRQNMRVPPPVSFTLMCL